MKKLIVLMPLLLSCLILNCQDNRYSLSYPVTTPDTSMAPGVVIKTDMANIQYCLGKYHQERRIGTYIEIGALVTGSACFVSVFYGDSQLASQLLLVASVGLAVSTLAIYIDADKWLKRGTIKLSPGSVRVYF
jgi:hypothetical protein